MQSLFKYIFIYSEYTTIKDLQQRKRYKEDFNAHYNEYRDLHGIVEKVSRRFAELEERLKKMDTSSREYRVSEHLCNTFSI